MAINPETLFVGKITPSSAAFPFGQARNITIPGDGRGTPFVAALINDVFGFQQSLLSAADLVPSGTPDEVGASQYLEALRVIVARASSVVFASLSDLQAGLDQAGKVIDTTTVTTARVLGFATANDGGGAEWRRDGTTGAPNTVSPATGQTFDAAGDGWTYIFTAGPVAREVNPMAFGAAADGATDSTEAFNGGLAYGDVLRIPSTAAGFAATGVTVPTGKSVAGTGRRSVVAPFNSGNAPVFHLEDYAAFRGVRVTGADGKASGLTNQHGVSINNKSRTIVTEYWADGLGGSAYFVTQIVGNHQGNTLNNYAFESCNVGVDASVRGEYQQMGAGSVTLCNTGLRIQGGNFNGVGTVVSDNDIGVHLVAGANDAHGQLVGVLLNHNVTRTVLVDAPANGFLFNGCQMFNGGAIELLNCTNVWFRNCVKQAIAVIEDGCTQCGFQANDFLDGTNNTPNANGNASEVFYLDNNLPPGTTVTGANGLGGGFLRLEQAANTSSVATGDTDLDWDTKVNNSITGNLSYTVQSFFDVGTANPFIRADIKFVRMQGPLRVQSQITLGKSGAVPWVAGDVTIKILDVTGAVVGYYTPKTQASDPSVAETIRYHFSGDVPRGAFKVVIENNSGVADVTIYRHQVGTDILTFMTVSGW